ncbi:hypothetical protein K470DRAFT_278819 [Piedraia hortae CBS 480.64]|uniref:Uncharacterized protein n=1 Tax=Piedraia hortae CBS 480.64 TaxID=1314780 RepID=A0A6A7BSI5_9PEZI|nr:hypothetical protein K470DRAFT_278819 [Piedraia hortae CBS 480.64]
MMPLPGSLVAAFLINNMAKSKKKMIAMAQSHFKLSYGVDESRLEGWQRLCSDVGIEPANSIRQCKLALSKVNINLVDFVNAMISGSQVHHFPSKNALRDYIASHGNEKTFPLRAAKANGYLKALLITLWR